MARATNPWRLRVLALLACAAAVGCATPQASPRTTVVLLPDEDGSVGAVSVRSAAGTQLLDQAFSAATIGGTASPVLQLGREQVEARYGDLLKAQPSKPAAFTLHFVLDKTTLTDESKALLPALLEAVRERKPTEIVVFGHADASGSEERNFKLSAERAKAVADLLRRHDPTLDRIELQSFGDKAPAVPAKSRVAEPRNRRAEVVIL